MQNLQDLQEKIFFESKTILETLSRINSKEELLTKQDLFAEVTDRIAFLRILEKNKDSFMSDDTVEKPAQEESRTFSGNEIMSPEFSHFDDAPLEEDIIEEEVMFTNELNEIENEEPDVSTEISVEKHLEIEDEAVEEELLAAIETEY
ncbi:MAG TPA: hypothetical protein DCL65_10075, partial [Chryseobacterium sp.]|nr:hypothetical protein [Chryseobacterium sp.]